MTSQQPADTAYQPTRRTVVKGAAWSLPVIAVAAAAPLAAASVDPPSPCDPPKVLPGTSAWTVDGIDCQQGGNGYVSYQLGNLLGAEYYDGSKDFVRLYADANPSIPGDAYAWGIATLGELVPGATYVFSAEVRGQYATHSNDNEVPDPDHQNSFRTDVQGWIHNLVSDEKIAVTDRWSTRADVAPAGTVQIPNLNDDVSKRRMKISDGVPWNPMPAQSFTVPLYWVGETQFRWEFTVANRNARLVKENPASGGEPWWNDAAAEWTRTANDDVDVTYPVFSTAYCEEPAP